jgi:hypothetical protein
MYAECEWFRSISDPFLPTRYITGTNDIRTKIKPGKDPGTGTRVKPAALANGQRPWSLHIIIYNTVAAIRLLYLSGCVCPWVMAVVNAIAVKFLATPLRQF